MRRRLFLLTLLLPLFAETRPDVVDFLGSLASALSEGNAIAFLEAFDRSMPGYDQFQSNVTALIEQGEVLSSIEVLSDEGDERHRSLELDWFLQIRIRQEAGPVERRRESVSCRLERKQKRWKIISLEPAGLFAPPRSPVQ